MLEGSDLRRGRLKAALVRGATGRCLMIGVETGLDIAHVPRGLQLVAIDISDDVLQKAAPRAAR